MSTEQSPPPRRSQRSTSAAFNRASSPPLAARRAASRKASGPYAKPLQDASSPPSLPVPIHEASTPASTSRAARRAKSSSSLKAKASRGRRRSPQPTSPQPDQPSGPSIASSSSDTSGDRVYRLVVVQQPERGAALGMSEDTSSRLPIIPGPVVKLVVTNAEGVELDDDIHALLCQCSVVAAESDEPLDLVEFGASGPRSVLVGRLMSDAYRVPDLEGKMSTYFTFWDLAVRSTGRYRLHFKAARLPLPPTMDAQSDVLAQTTSSVFEVVPTASYSGAHVTALTEHLIRQGVRMYQPPMHELSSS